MLIIKDLLPAICRRCDVLCDILCDVSCDNQSALLTVKMTISSALSRWKTGVGDLLKLRELPCFRPRASCSKNHSLFNAGQGPPSGTALPCDVVESELQSRTDVGATG